MGQSTIPKIPIIGLSGNARDEQMQAAINQGMDDYLTKPYSKEALMVKIDLYTAARDGRRVMDGRASPTHRPRNGPK